MIVYLGMPRCASSWLYNHLANGIKETHYLYTNPVDVENYSKNQLLDFSTNNWSMDSDIAQLVDKYTKHYIFIFRDPVELAKSYKVILENTQTLEEFVQYQTITKLLCYGDIIERWYNLVDPAKILIYDYADVGTNDFLLDIAKETGLTVEEYNNTIVNASNLTLDETISNDLLDLLKYQVSKLEKITKRPFRFQINNLL